MLETWYCTVRREVRVGQALGEQRGDLPLGFGEGGPAGLGPAPRAVRAAPDPVRPQPGIGPGRIPDRVQPFITALRGVELDPGFTGPARRGQQIRGVLPG